MNNAAMNVYGQVFFFFFFMDKFFREYKFSFLLGVYLQVELLCYVITLHV